MEENCIFCNILKGTIPSTKLFEDEYMIIIKDIHPIAPIHNIAILKEHYAILNEQNAEQNKILGQCLHKIGLLKDELGLSQGFRVIVNQGKFGGQSVEHLHIHILGGKELNWELL